MLLTSTLLNCSKVTAKSRKTKLSTDKHEILKRHNNPECSIDPETRKMCIYINGKAGEI